MRAALVVIGVVFAAFFLMHRCSQNKVSTSAGQGSPIELRQQALDQIVLLQPLKQYDAKEYDKLQQVANNALQPNEVADDVRSTLWWRLRSIVEAQADDEGQQLWAKAYLQQLYDAKSKANCFPFSFPLYSKTSTDEKRALLTQRTQQQSAEALTYILTHHGGKRSKVDQTPEGWASVAGKLSQDYGDDADLINAGETAKDKYKQCNVVISTFEYMLALPEEQRGQVIRWLLGRHIAVAVF